MVRTLDGRALTGSGTGASAESPPTACPTRRRVLHRREQDGLWVGRKSGGLTHLSLQRRLGRARGRTAGRTACAEDSVYAVHESRDGTVWAGTLSGGVSRLRDGRFTTYTVADGLASNTVTSIVDGADGTTWFATPNGLSALREGRMASLDDSATGLPSDDVNCLLEDSAGVLWIGTDEGLALRTPAASRSPRRFPPRFTSRSSDSRRIARDGSGSRPRSACFA